MRTAPDHTLRSGRHRELAPRPHAALDVTALWRVGQRPFPFRQFILKVHGRCDLDCTYCVIYQSQEASWRGRPARVSPEVMRRTTHRITEHTAVHGLSEARALDRPGIAIRTAHEPSSEHGEVRARTLHRQSRTRIPPSPAHSVVSD
ncbi:hypothetical protein [Streptomyces prunicolor]|uniref:hypothetical protein n=1 Tax=Streptomyces prunicolor TaxID=67348 RepID=UPI00341B7CCC